MLRSLCFVSLLTVSSALVAIQCPTTTDVIILVESQPLDDSRDAFALHRETVVELVHRLPMHEEKVRVTVLQFNRELLKVVVIFRPSHYSPIDIASQVESQDKMNVLTVVTTMEPSISRIPGLSNLQSALREVDRTIIPMLGYNASYHQNSGIIIAVIVSGKTWITKEPNKLNDIITSLRRKGAMLYTVAYKMDKQASRSFLPEIVTKPEFLILPNIDQANIVASHLTNVFQVCWKEGPCWPDNPCIFGCSCIEDGGYTNGYYCKGSKNHWLGENCNNPSSSLTCLPGVMVVRIPQEFVQKHKIFDSLFIGRNENYNMVPSKCRGKLITNKLDDTRIDPQVFKVFISKGPYYLLENKVMHDTCDATFTSDHLNETMTVENVVFATKSKLPANVVLQTAILRVRCKYNIKTLQPLHIRLQDFETRSFIPTISQDGFWQDDDSLPPANNLEESQNFKEGIIKSNSISFHPEDENIRIHVRVNYPNNFNPAICRPPYEANDPCLKFLNDSTTDQPTMEPDVTTQPTSYITTQPTSYATTQPTSDVTTQTTSYITTQPTSYITTQPTSDVTTQTTSYATTQPTSYATTQPTSDERTGSTQPANKTIIKLSLKLYYDKYFNMPIDDGTSGITSKVWAKITEDIPQSGSLLGAAECIVVRHCWLIANETQDGITDIQIIKDGCAVTGFWGARVITNGKDSYAAFSFHVFQWKIPKTNNFDNSNWVKCSARLCACNSCELECK